MVSSAFARFYKDKRSAYAILAVSLLVLLLPFFSRQLNFEGTMFGGIPSYHARMAEEFSEGMPEQDRMVYSSRDYSVNLYDSLLYGMSLVMPVKHASFFLPVILGFLSLSLFVLVLRQNKAKGLFVNLALSLLVTSPLFIFTFTHSNQFSLMIFLALLAFFLYHKKKRFWLSLPVFFIFPFFGTRVATILFLFLWFYSSRIGKEKRLIPVLFMILLAFAVKFFIPYDFGIVDYPLEQNVSEFISDLGGDFGIGIIHFTLFVLGFVVLWFDKRSGFFSKIFLLLLVLLIFTFDASIVFFYNFIVVLLSALAMESLLKRKWYSRELKRITILIIVCGLLFSLISYLDRTNSAMPMPRHVDSLSWIEEELPEGNILSAKDYGFMIQRISGNKVLQDPFSSDSGMLDSDVELMFYSRELEESRELMKRYNVSYLWITEEMRQGKIWHEEEEGLLFLLRNNQTFRKVYDEPGFAEVWEVVWVTKHYKIINPQDRTS